MSKTVRTMAPDQPASAAVKLMVKHDIGSVVIVSDSAKVVGIITERDLMRKVMSGSKPLNLKTPVSKIASKPVITATPDTKVWDAFAQMLRNKIRRLPVIQEGKLVGIVTERDLFKWVVKVVYEPNVPDDLKKLITQ